MSRIWYETIHLAEGFIQVTTLPDTQNTEITLEMAYSIDYPIGILF